VPITEKRLGGGKRAGEGRERKTAGRRQKLSTKERRSGCGKGPLLKRKRKAEGGGGRGKNYLGKEKKGRPPLHSAVKATPANQDVGGPFIAEEKGGSMIKKGPTILYIGGHWVSLPEGPSSTRGGDHRGEPRQDTGEGMSSVPREEKGFATKK